jgi:hypothetical protein
MILRDGEKRRDLAARFAQMVAYNIQNSASLLQSVHSRDQPIGMTAIFLSAADFDLSAEEIPPHTALAYARFQSEGSSGWNSDGSSMKFDGWRVAIRETAANAMELSNSSSPPSFTIQRRDTTEVTPCLREAISQGVSKPGYCAHVWPVLEAANVLMVMSPAFHIPGAQQRLRVGSCGLNLMLSRDRPVHPSVIETALQLARQLDSLFGTVQTLHQAQTRRQLTFEALNIISHSLKNRVDRLSGVYPGCARDLHVQKLSSLGAGQIEKQAAFVFDSVRTKLLWKESGFQGESITISLCSTIWSDRSDWKLDLSILEDLPADARWVTIIEELMENLHKRNISFKPQTS